MSVFCFVVFLFLFCFFLLNLGRSFSVQYCSHMMHRWDVQTVRNSLIGTDCKVFVIHCTCPTNQRFRNRVNRAATFVLFSLSLSLCMGKLNEFSLCTKSKTLTTLLWNLDCSLFCSISILKAQEIVFLLSCVYQFMQIECDCRKFSADPHTQNL